MTKTQYIETKINLTEQHKKKIASALKNRCTVTINLKPENAEGSDTFYFTKAQLSKLDKAFNAGKGVSVKLSMAQIKYNAKHGGQIAALAARALPYILPVAKKVLPALGLGALSGLADKAVKSIFGDGMYLNKNGQVAQIETDGEGLYIKTVKGSGNSFGGDGLFLVQDGKVQDGRGFLSHIPLIGPLLNMLV